VSSCQTRAELCEVVLLCGAGLKMRDSCWPESLAEFLFEATVTGRSRSFTGFFHGFYKRLRPL
jgi:hypothetical protein